VPVDFVETAMDAVMYMMNGSMHTVNQGVKKAGIPIRLDGAGIRDAAKTQDSCNEESNGGFHMSFFVVPFPKYRSVVRPWMQARGK
jgi:hypothetical protein